MSNIETPLTWLTVGGCPRSGTTALGEVLNQHPGVALFHEYDQAHLFATVKALFKEEDRLGVYAETDQFDLIPRRSKHELAIIQSLFQQVTGKTASVLGTKFPGAHLWPQPEIPRGMCWKQIHITRSPQAVVTSYAKKMLREGYPGGHARILDVAIAHWVSAWNYAAVRQNDPNFLHVLYEDLASDKTAADRIAGFLGLDSEPRLDFSGFRSADKTAAQYRQELETVGFGPALHRFDALAPLFHWDHWRHRLEPLGFPLAAGEILDLRGAPGANGWYFPAQGFYPPEPDGRWLHGGVAELALIPEFSAKNAKLTLEIAWVFEPGQTPPMLTLELDGQAVLRTPISRAGTPGGSPKSFVFDLQGLNLQAGHTAQLKLRVSNPRNPHAMGLSPDNRELSFMLSSLRLEP